MVDYATKQTRCRILLQVFPQNISVSAVTVVASVCPLKCIHTNTPCCINLCYLDMSFCN